MKKPLSYYLGNLLIVLSLSCFLYLGFPLISAFLFPPSPPSPTQRDYALWIPKIHAAGKIISDVDPWSASSYKEALKKGIASAKDFAEPGEKGTIFLFAHSSGMPWEQTRYNSVFLRLGELQNGDRITIWKDSTEYTYEVVGKKEVYPSEVEAVTKDRKDKDQLIIQTCTPLGTDWKRLLVFAKEVRN